MDLKKGNTLLETIHRLRRRDFTEDFCAVEEGIKSLQSKRLYEPNNVKIVKTFRFEGYSNPSDNCELFALKANDGTKGTLVMTYGAKHSQNINQIKKLKMEE